MRGANPAYAALNGMLAGACSVQRHCGADYEYADLPPLPLLPSGPTWGQTPMTALRPLKIALLWHAGNCGNLGLGALTWSDIILVDRAASAAGRQAQIDLLTTGDLDLSRLDALPFSIGLIQIRIQPTLLRSILGAFRLRRMLADYDVVVDIASGDSFASLYGGAVFRRQLATKFAAAMSPARFILAPQTIGPFTRTHSLLAGLVVSRADTTFCRDAVSAEFAQWWPGAKVEVVPDVAFALPPVGTVELSRDSINVGINPSGLLYRANPGDRYYVAGYRELMHGLLERLTSRADVTVHLVPHVLTLNELGPARGPDEDYVLCRELRAQYSGCLLPKPFVTAGEAKGYISGLDILHASRMHAAIAAVGTGVPAVAVAYSRKFRDTILTVGYELPFIDPAQTGYAAAVDDFCQLLSRLDVLRADVAGVESQASQGLKRYVALLAEQFASLG